jgi:hypothetical protein
MHPDDYTYWGQKRPSAFYRELRSETMAGPAAASWREAHPPRSPQGGSSYRWQFTLLDRRAFTTTHVQCDAIWHNGSLTVTPPLGRTVNGMSLIQARIDTAHAAAKFLVSLGATRDELAISLKVQPS